MAWSVHIWKIFGFPKVSLYLERFVLKTRHSSYTNTLYASSEERTDERENRKT